MKWIVDTLKLIADISWSISLMFVSVLVIKWAIAQMKKIPKVK